MRLSTANAYNNSLHALMDRQTQLSATNEQMTSAKRVNVASDDPAAAARAERALSAQNRSDASQRAVDASNNAMTLSESALHAADDLLQTARETLVQAGNATLSDPDRQSLATTLQGLRSQLLSVANSTDGQGTYLFGGQGAGQVPFVDTTSGVQYRGSAGAAGAASTDGLTLTTAGDATWMQARTGNGVFATSAVTSKGSAWIDSGTVTDPKLLPTDANPYSIDFSVAAGVTTYSISHNGPVPGQANLPFRPGTAIVIDGMSATISGSPANLDSFQLTPSTSDLSAFQALDNAITDLKTPGRSGSQIAQSNSQNLIALDAVVGKVSASRSQMGEAMNRIGNVTDRIAAQKLSATTALSNATDLDMVQAYSDFSSQQTGYDAALKAYSLVQKLSLFNYLSA